MSEPSFSEAVKFTAPTGEQTTGSEVANPGTSAEQEPPEQQEPKTFTQEELDRIVQERLAKERRKIAKEQRDAAQQPQVPTERPRREQFKDEESYTDAVADWKADQKIQQREQREQQNKVETSFEEKMDAARAKYGNDFDAKLKGDWYCSDVALAAIKESDIGPDIVFHLASHPEESKRIWDLKSPVSQVREIGKIEAKLAANPPVKKSSSAPEPITPLGSRSSTPNYSASDPRSLKMPMADWAAARNKELAAKRR